MAAADTHSKISTMVPSLASMVMGGRSVTSCWARRAGTWPAISRRNASR
jgi:hypothetical protein